MGFKLGDLVKVIISEEDDLGFVDYISAIDEDGLICVGDEDLPYPRGCWHTDNELAPATEPKPADAPAVDGLAPLTYDVYQDAPANAMGLVQGVDEPLDGETFHEWVAREGRRVEDAAFYWKQIAADNMELGSRGMDDRDAQIADLRSQLAALQAANTRLANALEPFAEAWLQVPLGLASALRVWNGQYGDEAKYPILGISTDTLQDAHTAHFGLPEATSD